MTGSTYEDGTSRWYLSCRLATLVALIITSREFARERDRLKPCCGHAVPAASDCGDAAPSNASVSSPSSRSSASSRRALVSGLLRADARSVSSFLRCGAERVAADRSPAGVDLASFGVSGAPGAGASPLTGALAQAPRLTTRRRPESGRKRAIPHERPLSTGLQSFVSGIGAPDCSGD